MDSQGRRAGPGELVGSVLTFGGACGGEGRPDRMGRLGVRPSTGRVPRTHKLGVISEPQPDHRQSRKPSGKIAVAEPQ